MKSTQHLNRMIIVRCKHGKRVIEQAKRGLKIDSRNELAQTSSLDVPV